MVSHSLFLCFVIFTCISRPTLADELNEEQAPEIPPGIAPEPTPAPMSPAPIPPLTLVPDYMFDLINSSNPVGTRYEAVMGSSADFTMIYLLGGGSNNTMYASTNWQFDLGQKKWTDLGISFTRKGACAAQDNSRNGLWIYGGDITGTNNSATFLQFNFASKAFTPMSTPNLPKTGASCAVSGDGSSFYVLFGELSLDEFDQVDNCSATVGVYSNGNWTTPKINGTVLPRVGASANMYGNSIVVFGGVCNNAFLSGVSRLDTNSFTWSTDTMVGQPPSARAYSSVFILGDYMYVYGGLNTVGALNDAYVYNLKTNNWTTVDTTLTTLPSPRYNTATVALQNRGLVYGGENTAGQSYADLVQFVSQVSCFGPGYGCEDCTSTATGCGWCTANDNAKYRCIAGDLNQPFVPSSCNSSNTNDYVTDLDFCPQLFPSYAIALLVIGGVVLVGVVIFAIMKVRSGGEEKSGYERIS